jgi:hypothetical protein
MIPPDVRDDEPLTQYGHAADDPPFRNVTRSYETDVSLVRLAGTGAQSCPRSAR